MLIESALFTTASGSVGGITAGRNRGGLYFRARTTPTDPNTQRQQTVRANMAFFVARWNNTLTQAQRDTWDAYAKNVPLIGPLGNPRTVSPMNHFIRLNLPRFQAAFAGSIDVAPSVFTHADLSPAVSATATAFGNKLNFGFSQDDSWLPNPQSALIVWGGRPVNPGVKFFAGPYRFAGRLPGFPPAGPTSPFAATSAYPLTVGQRVFFKARVSLVDGRLSPIVQVSAIVA